MKGNRRSLKACFYTCAIASTLAVTGCGDSKKSEPIVDHNGVWQQVSTGEVWQFSNQGLVRFNLNTAGCVEISNKDLASISTIDKHLVVQGNKLTLNNDATNNWQFSKLPELPTSCSTQNKLSTNSPVDNFEFFWHHFNEHYAFFELRGIDWDEVYAEYRPKLTDQTSSAELTSILAEIIEKFDDSHVALTAGEEDLSSVGEYKGLAAEAIKYLVRSGESNLDELFAPLYQQLLEGREQLVNRYITAGALSKYQNSDAISWGVMSNNLGYLKITREHQMLASVADSNDVMALLANASKDLQDTDVVMQAAISALKNTDALIIDLRVNEGGYDKVSQKIASYFNDKQRVFASKKSLNKGKVTEEIQLTLDTVDTPYTKPIFVINGQSNVSAGEVLALALKSIPHVSLVGQSSNGSVSDVLGFTMPNGWTATLSHQVYTDALGGAVEGGGVIPQTFAPVYALEDFEYGSDNAVDLVLQKLNQPLPYALNSQQLDTLIEQTRSNLMIPGLAVAVVHDGKIVFEKGYGEKVLGSGVAVTEHSPFNIGSISKAVMATAIAQKLEQGKLNLDKPISEFNLPFTVGHPNAKDAITLRHLVTHTSGIADTLTYNCNYYIHGTELSLFAAFGAEYCSQNAIVDPTEFYQAYFATSGGLNEELPYHTVEPGQSHNYSNVGAGLAAYAIESYLNIDFSDEMTRTLFEPLGMKNTRWKHTELSEQNSKTAQYTFTKENEAIELPEYSYPTFYDGDLNSSAHDLARLMLAISAGGELDGVRVLTQDTVNNMMQNQTGLSDFVSEQQGLFWFRNGVFIGHTGGDPGTSATMQYNPITKTGIVFMMNIEDDQLGNEVLGQKLSSVIASLYHYGVSQ